jgi:HEAT repeat protein
LGAEGTEAVPVLLELIADEQHAVRYKQNVMASALSGYPSEHIGRPFESSPVVRSLQAIGRADSSVVPALLSELQHKDPNVRSAVVVALGGMGDGNAKTAEPMVRELLGDDAPLVRVSCAIALERIGPDALTRARLRILAQSDESASVRKAAVNVLPAAVESVSTLIQALTDGDGLVVHAALAKLAQTGPAADRAVPAVTTVLCDTARDQGHRGQAARTLARIGAGRTDVVTTLRETLKDEHSRVRLCCAVALGVMGTAAQPAIPDIKRLLVRERTMYARRHLMNALQAIEGSDTEGRIPQRK